MADTQPIKKPRRQRRNFQKVYPENHRIAVLVARNPKRKGTLAHDRFEDYYGCKTVSDALLRGISYKHLDQDVERGYIKVEAA